jgi:2-(1,2-epoxy-1,2-dihydrophenyl)acetyl-CoA isomerase
MEFVNGVAQEMSGTTRIVRLSNPGRKNAFTPAMRRSVAQCLMDAAADSGVRAVVLTGEGGDFCAGGDISGDSGSAAQPMTIVQTRERMRDVHQLLSQIVFNPKPVVVAVEGDAFGAGLSMACAADIVVGARNARFGAAFSRVGLSPDLGLLYTLPQRIGLAKARRMMMLSERMTGEEAFAAGLVDELCEPGEALPHALTIAERFAEVGPIAVTLIKATLAEGLANANDVMHAEVNNISILVGTEDIREGMKAFRERRPPRFLA